MASLVLGAWREPPPNPGNCVALSLAGNPKAMGAKFSHFIAADECEFFVNSLVESHTLWANTLAARKALFRRMNPRRGQARMENADRDSTLARWANAAVIEDISSEGAQLQPGTPIWIGAFHSLLFSSHVVAKQHVQLRHPTLFGYFRMDVQ